MIEVEIKIKIKDLEELQEKLSRDGFCKGEKLRETDLYFNGADRNFKQTDEALRIRKTEYTGENRSKTYLTYKGPKIDTVSMSRKELEVSIENADIMKEMLLCLGYRPVSPVIKTRQYYHGADLTACVDQVEGLGNYLELEILVEKEEQRKTALNRIARELEYLGYSMEETTRISYLSLLEEREKENFL